MSYDPNGWLAAALLTRHYAGLPGVIRLFLLGPDRDGPEITEEQAAEAVTEVFGRASRCTYGGLRRVDAGELKAALKTVTGETISTAEAKSLSECLGALAITQPVCENGHLPVRFTGPTTFAFQGTDQQCPACRGRVLDPDPTEFVLVWTEGRLGHAAEREVDGGDGRLVPTRGEDLAKAVGTLHPWFEREVDGERPSNVEIAMVLFNGTPRGVPAIANGTKVIEAMRNPAGAGLDEWTCGTVLRAARGAHRKATNPFRVVVTSDERPGMQPIEKQQTSPNALRAHIDLLLKFYSSAWDMGRIVGYHAEDVKNVLPDRNVSPLTMAEAITRELDSRGLIDADWFNLLRRERERRVREVDAVAALFGI